MIPLFISSGVRALTDQIQMQHNFHMSHAKATSKERNVNLWKAYGLAGFGETKEKVKNEGGRWLPKSGGAMPSKKDKMSDRQHQRKQIHDITGIWVK